MPFFLFSLRRRTRSPFSSKKTFCSSCAGEFSRHFVCGKSLHGTVVVFFFHGKKFFNEKKFFLRIFFLKLENQVQKFPGRTKIADFRKNAEDWKHCLPSNISLFFSNHSFIQKPSKILAFFLFH